MNQPKTDSDSLINVGLTLIVNLVVLLFSVQRWIELKVDLWRSVWIIPCIIYISVIAICSYLLFRRGLLDSLRQKPLARLFNQANTSIFFSKAARVIFFILASGIILLIPWLKFAGRVGEVVKNSTQDPVLTTIVFYWLVWWLVLMGSFLMMGALHTTWKKSFAFFLVLSALSYEFYLRFQGVSSYPFSLGWSETSRYYYASLFFSEKLYQADFPLSILHPSRYLLQSIPFLLPGSDLFTSRIWQAILWIVLTGITSILLPQRILADSPKYKKDLLVKFILSGSIFLLMLRVGVYYHLQPIVFIPLLLTSQKNDLKTMVGLILASAWAGISRINWFPMPALIIALLYLYEVPVSSKKNILHYFVKPTFFFVIGLATAYLSQQAYIVLSENTANAEAFSSSFSSNLIWNRLLPNQSYPLGVILGILLVSSPILFHFLFNFSKISGKFHPLRTFGISLILFVFFIGGLVVSVKIGGGADLHNMDAFAVMLILACLLIFSTETATENGDILPQPFLYWPVLVFGLLLPIIFLLPALKPFAKFNSKNNEKALSTLITLVQTSAAEGDVLFINERHLVTFGKINVPMVNDYEAVTLMEMAMSGNQPYLQSFYAKLKQHQFSAIVSAKLNTGLKVDGLFFEENNVWNSVISRQILCYYKPVVLQTAPELTSVIEADESKIIVLVPKEIDGDCP